MNFEQLVILHHNLNHLITSVVKIIKLLALIVCVQENILLFIHLHVEQKLEQQFTHTKILANGLPLLHRQNLLSLCFRDITVLDKSLDLLEALVQHDHSFVSYFLLSPYCSPFKLINKAD